MVMLDQKFRDRKLRYILQCGMAAVSTMVVLAVLYTIANAAVIGALGASAFIVFTMPHRARAKPRYLIGGYIIGIIVGSICYWSSRALVPDLVSPTRALSVNIAFASLAVGLAIFLMVVTNTEHPPAAGVAMGLVLGEWHWQTVLLVLVGISCFAGIKRLLKRFLIDLL